MAGKKSQDRFAARDEKFLFTAEEACKFLDEKSFGSRILLNVGLNLPTVDADGKKTDKVIKRKAPFGAHVHKHVAQAFIRQNLGAVEPEARMPVHALGSDILIG